ncbi:MAG: rod shape-determining protein MreC, partial [Armatimonadetes bacterium]|nr:rod shape-determining protein MreC [Armatimonadota bacterium]
MRIPAYPVVIAAVLGAGLVLWQNSASSRGGVSAPAGVAAATLSPLQRTLKASGDWLGDVGRVLVRRADIASQNEALQLRVADLEGQNARLSRLRRENVELRKLLEMPKVAGGRSLAAEIISYDASDFARRVTLNIGSRAGVAPKDVVYCAQGLVGQVTQVAPLTCVVTLLIDREGRAGAMTARTFAKGVIRGTGERICKLSYLDFNADVREGDLVTTSGLLIGRGAIFPKGMVIGRVVKVEKDKTYSRHEADVEPAVPFDRLSAVWVRVNAEGEKGR